MTNKTTTELKAIAKELKVKNWWTLKKEDLITEIEKVQTPPVQLPELTELESQAMADIPKNDFYEDGLDSVLWTDIYLESSSIPSKQLRGVLSSLSQKGLLSLYSTKKSSNGGDCTDSTLSLTNSGKIWMVRYLAGEIKVEAKATVKESAPQENIITIKEIIGNTMKGTKARRLLRNANIERPYKRWEWHTEDHKEIIAQIQKILK